ncbi:MAG TPA: M24 family metallopeptidase [Candidatus Limnocylindria bacterium]|nr:M24 family metallopeptidase [Candidatus Limnocylindria bacterium]
MTDSLFPRFSDSEYTRRFNVIRAAMSQGNLDAILVSGARGSSEVAYLSNYQAQSPCWLLFPRDGDATVFIHFFNHQPCAKAQSIMADVRWYGPTPMPTLVEEIKRRGLSKSKIGLVSMRSMAYGNVIELQRQFPAAEFVEFGPQFAKIRRVRSEEELVYLRRSGYLTDLACEALENNLRAGLTEKDVLAIVYNAYVKNGGDPGIHFIATTNMDKPDRFVPWQRQTSRVLETGSVVITELTVSYWGYSTQIHRPFAIGKEPTPTYRRLFDAAYECYESVRKICKPGTTSEQIIAATSAVEANGFTSFDSVFHGEAGKSPELGTSSAAHPVEKWTLEENMVHVIQPNPITKDFTAGLQLGAAVVVKPGGGEALHNYPFKFPVCG